MQSTGYQPSNGLEDRLGNDAETREKETGNKESWEKLLQKALVHKWLAELMTMVIYICITHEQ
jgi:hypothetical protein